MPAKKKKKGKGKGKGKGKAKKVAVIDGISTDDMTKEQLEEHVIRLREEIDREREERNFFQLERDKVASFWDITKQQLEESKAAIRNKERELEDEQEKHQVEIKVYKQKVKHLLYEHQSNITELKRDATVAVTLEQHEHETKEGNLKSEKRTLKVDMKEMELAHQETIKTLKMEHDKELTKTREDFERLSTELQKKHESKMQSLREELELRRKTEIHEVEERKNGQINSLMKNHEKAFSDIKNYYNDITLNNLALINSLKDQVEKMKRDQDRLEKQLAETQSENRRLMDPLQKAREEVAELQKQLSHYERDKVSLSNAKARLKVQESELKSLRWEHEVLEQRFSQTQQERDDLYKKFIKAINEVQQKTGFKNALLEKKLRVMEEAVERKETQLNEVMSSCHLDPTAVEILTRKIEDVLDHKNAQVKDLRFELSRVCKAHNDLAKTYEAKLATYGIPVENLGFRPMQNAMTDEQLGEGPAGLVASPM